MFKFMSLLFVLYPQLSFSQGTINSIKTKTLSTCQDQSVIYSASFLLMLAKFSFKLKSA